VSLLSNMDGGVDGTVDFQYQPVTYRYGDIYVPYIPMKEPLNVECRHFVECMQTGTEPRSSGGSAMRVTSVLESASASVKNGGIRQQVAQDVLPGPLLGTEPRLAQFQSNG